MTQDVEPTSGTLPSKASRLVLVFIVVLAIALLYTFWSPYSRAEVEAAAATLEVTLPVITGGGVMADGGSVDVFLHDAAGKRLDFQHDGFMGGIVDPVTNEMQDYVGGKLVPVGTPRQMEMRVIDDSADYGVVVELGGEIDQALLVILKSSSMMSSKYKNGIKSMIAVLEERIETQAHIPGR